MKHLAWIDLEMTGLNPETDVILEIALIITDLNFKVVKKCKPITIGYNIEDLNFTFTPDTYDTMMIAFTDSGLLDRIQNSTTSIEEAENIILKTLQKHCVKKECHLAGNSVWRDATFIYKYMPNVWDFLHYRLLDVSTIKLIHEFWYPEVAKLPKKDLHDALEDILESIEEMKYYKKNILQ